MNKNYSPTSHTACLWQRTRSLNKYKICLKIPDNQNIPSLQQAEQRVKSLQKRHKWRKQRRLKLLHDTYDQNCKLYFSINSQKSVYSLYRTKLEEISHHKRSISPKRYTNQEDLMNRQEKGSKSTLDQKQLKPDHINGNTQKFRFQIRQILKQTSLINKMQKEQRAQQKKLQTLNSCLRVNKKSQKNQQLKQFGQLKNTFGHKRARKDRYFHNYINQQVGQKV